MPRERKTSGDGATCDRAVFTLGFEHTLSLLFGKARTHGLVGDHDAATTRRYYVKILEAMQTCFEQNVIATDPRHRTDVLRRLESTRETIGTTDSPTAIQGEMIDGLVRLCFDLLGGMPNHWDRRNVTRYDWDLDRCVCYGQTNEQRARMAWRRIDGNWGADPDAAALRGEANLVRTKPLHLQLAWIAEKFPELYSDLFGVHHA